MNYEEILEHMAAENDRLVVMTAENRAAIRNLPAKLGDRFIDVGICEQTMIGAAAGLALRGRIPVTHALATFITLRAFEFIRTDVGIGNLPVKMVGGVPGFLSEANGPTHQAVEDVALMRGIPNVNVFCPADVRDMEIGLQAVLESPAPFYIRHNPIAAQYEHTEHFEIGRAEVVDSGTDVAILVYGFLFREALTAKSQLESRGISVRILNLRTVKPVDTEAILAAARECSLLVTLEDHFLTGGLYSIVAELFLEHQITHPVLPFALKERWFTPGLLEEVLKHEGFTGAQIAESILRRLESVVSPSTANEIAIN